MSTYAEILDLIASSSSSAIDLPDNRAALTVSQVRALVAAGVTFAGDDVLTVEDTGGEIGSLTAAEIGALKTLGASEVIGTGSALSLTLAQINAFAGQDIAAYSQYETLGPRTPHDSLVGDGYAGSASGMTTIALADGSYAVLYKDTARNIVVQRVDAHGKALGNVVVASPTSTTLVGQPVISALSDGGYVVSWRSEIATLSMQHYDADGELVSSSSLETSATWRVAPSITGLTDGGYVVTFYQYEEGSGESVVVQRFDAGGTALGEAQTLTSQDAIVLPSIGNDGAELTQTIELANGKVMVVWVDGSGMDGGDWGVMAQIFDGAGGKVGNAFSVSTVTAGDQFQPSVTALSNGGLAVAWLSDYGTIAVRVFDDEGNEFDGEIAVNTSNHAQDLPQIVALENGNFVVTWTWLGQDDPNATSSQHDGVYSQLIGADGSKIGSVTLVNTTTVGSQKEPQIVALKGGGYVIVWSENIENSGDSYEINAQVFDAEGNRIGGELEINDTETGFQLYQEVTALAGGGFAVTWYDSGDGKFYTRAFHNDTEAASFSDTAANISALKAADVADLSELGITRIAVSDAGSVTLSKAIAVQLAAISGLAIDGAASVTVNGAGAALEGFSASDIAALHVLGVTRLDASDNKVSLSFEQALAYVEAGITFASADAVTMKLNMMQLVTMSNSTMDGLLQLGLKVLDLEENAVSLEIVGFGMLKAYGLSFAPSDVLTLVISQSGMSALTTNQIGELASQGVTRIDIYDAGSAPTTLSLAQANAIAAAGIVFAQDNGTWVLDTAAALAALDATGIAVLAAAGIQRVIAEQALSLSASQFSAYADRDIVVYTLEGAVSVRDTGATLAALDASRIAKLSDFGITAIDATDNKVALSFSVLEAYRAANASFSAEDRVLLSVTSASLGALGADDLANAADFGVSALTTSDTEIDLAAATAARMKASGLSFDTGFTARISDTAANLLALSPADVASLSDIGIDAVRLADTGSAIAALSLASIIALDGKGVSQVGVTDGTVILSLAQANKFAEYQIAFDSVSTVVVTASSTTLSDPDTLDLAGLKAINIDRIDASDNKLALSLTAARNFVDAGIGFAPDDAVSVTITYAEAKTLAKATGSALHAAGVDRIEIDMTAQELKALTYAELKAFVAAGVDGIVGVSVVTFSNLTYDLATHTINYNPVITSNGAGSSAAISMAENTTAVTTVKATDQNAGSTLSFSIAGGADRALFSINAKTGALSFKSAPDHENPADNGKDNAYDVVIQVSDGKLIDTQAIKVSVRDVNEAPTSPALSGTSVKENVAVGTTVGTLSAKDPEGRTLSYTLTDNAGGLFKLSGNKLVTARAVDYETVKSGKVTVAVSDGVNTVAKTFTIGVQDVNEAPTSLALSGTSVKENVAVGTTVGTLSAKDPEGKTLTYKLTDNAGGLFKLDGNKLVTAKAVDYETVKSGKVTVAVSDGVNKVTKTFTIGVQDVNEAPTSLALSGTSVKENVAVGTTVGTLSAKDPEGRTLTYKLTDNAGGLFKLDGNKLVTAKAVDYEAVKSGKVTVEVSDGVNKVAKTFTIAIEDVDDANKAPTSLSLSKSSVKENVKTGTTVGTFSAVDPEGKALTYKLTDTADGLFKLSGTKLVSAKAIDYEKVQKDTVTLQVTDADGASAKKTFTIKITDVVETIAGTAKSETLKGGIGADLIKGNGGNDTL
ncbi:hypothetical protein SAMN05892877_118116, partial [Rhizobium subbaraonis]